jgi:propionate CoA-transferase
MLLSRPLADRFSLDANRGIMFIDFAGYRMRSTREVEEVRAEVERRSAPLGRKIEAVIDYDGCSIDLAIAEAWFDMARDVQARFYEGDPLHDQRLLRLKLGDALTRREMAPHVVETASEMAADAPAPAR